MAKGVVGFRHAEEVEEELAVVVDGRGEAWLHWAPDGLLDGLGAVGHVIDLDEVSRIEDRAERHAGCAGLAADFVGDAGGGEGRSECPGALSGQ